jgi:hypothetical protein
MASLLLLRRLNTMLQEETMAQSTDVDFFILHLIHEQGACSMDRLCDVLSRFTTNQILLAVDRLSREGKIVLEHPDRFEYLISPTYIRSPANIGVNRPSGAL